MCELIRDTEKEGQKKIREQRREHEHKLHKRINECNSWNVL